MTKNRSIGVLLLPSLLTAALPASAGPVGIARTLTVEQQVTLNRVEARGEQIGRKMPEPPQARTDSALDFQAQTTRRAVKSPQTRSAGLG